MLYTVIPSECYAPGGATLQTLLKGLATDVSKLQQGFEAGFILNAVHACSVVRWFGKARPSSLQSAFAGQKAIGQTFVLLTFLEPDLHRREYAISVKPKLLSSHLPPRLLLRSGSTSAKTRLPDLWREMHRLNHHIGKVARLL